MYNFSVLIDDGIAESFEGKIKACNSLLINNIELDDMVDGREIAGLSGKEKEGIRNVLIANNKKIVILNCSKPVTDHDYYKKVFRSAHMLGVENIKVEFEGNASDEDASEKVAFKGAAGEAFVIENLKYICSIGASYGINVLFENNSRFKKLLMEV